MNELVDNLVANTDPEEEKPIYVRYLVCDECGVDTTDNLSVIYDCEEGLIQDALAIGWREGREPPCYYCPDCSDLMDIE